MDGDPIELPALEQLSNETIHTLGVIVASHARPVPGALALDEDALRGLHDYFANDAIWAAVKIAAGLK